MEKYNNYYLLIHYGKFCVEQLQEMSEYEINEMAREIKKELNK
jgi:ribosomal protein L29